MGLPLVFLGSSHAMETLPRGPQCRGDPPRTCLDPLSVMGPSCPTDRLVLQVPARALLEGDTVTLRCRRWQNKSVTGVRFYHKEKDLGGPLNGTELSLSPLQLHHCGRYRCNCQVGTNRLESVPVTVTVHGGSTHRTPHSPAVAAGVAGSLLFLLLLLGVTMSCQWWQHKAARKPQDRAPRSLQAPGKRGRCCTPTL
ncbi:low affinity immunoglobulin gamma Fc region receptor II-like isoform X2 [Corvus kubaryi]|uniref:low affinity immunoglobulin gamma Fc region receptor II-like isoform X2 n=1 Tax=Corvus kubaryi TaxID=68294 RepID=UPI001C056241|nr:low affinity immunoglobulin gamma Fc region receptor II-like isoform X2 [Corvus kubaryi]